MVCKTGVVLGLLLVLTGLTRAQKIDEHDRADAREMLRMVAEDVRKNYYDPQLLAEFEGRVVEADAKIKSATLLGQAFAMIGWALDGLHDSHTRFLPPGRMHILQYGWRMQFVGDRCYVTRIRPGSDAEKKGLRAGDQILSINGLPLIREDFSKVQYILSVLAPQPDLKLQVHNIDGQDRQLLVSAKIKEVPKIMDMTDPGVFYRKILRDITGADRDVVVAKCIEEGDPLIICKLRVFDLDDPEIRRVVNVAKKHQGLILDLRDNPGGAGNVLEEFLGGFFDHEVKIGDRIGRKPLKPMVAKPEKDPFTGKLVVLVDSNSASAAEIFARTIQLEKRGTIIGDRSSGSVMGAQFFSHRLGAGTFVYFGAEVTEMNLRMPDGQTLEGKGVIPDELLLPKPAELSRGEDPVLAHAAELLGVKIAPAEAAKLFPYEWPH
ncbi:MAG: PDZ domain-containing protein [Acidobacteriia bacterium]|nr:PDZ domain-containing protein [Terriglobia bacterium]